MPKTKSVYEEVRERDNGQCQMCFSRNMVEVHHIIYRSRLGPDEAWNLICLCKFHHNMAHGLIPNRTIYDWQLLLQVKLELGSLGYVPEGPFCLSCEYLIGSECEVWEHPVTWDYSCSVWKEKQRNLASAKDADSLQLKDGKPLWDCG